MAVENLADFNLFLQREGRDLPRRSFVAYRRRVVTDIVRETIPQTPVDTGELKRSWELTVDEQASAQRETFSPIGDALEALRAATEIDSVIYWQNLAPHAPVIEFGLFVPPNPGPSRDPRPERRGRILVRDGFSTQAPRGVLGDVVQRVLDRHRRTGSRRGEDAR